MKYIEIEKFGGPDVLKLKEGPRPEPGAGEVLIRVEAAGVNRPDILQRQGHYPPPPGSSPVLGLEVAGEIVAVGPRCESTRARLGDKVCALVSGGGYAEFCVAPAVQCLPIPPAINVIEAAAIPETFFTVWTNVFARGRLGAGETILIHGGTSGIGTTAIQLAKVFGARVFVTAGSDEKCQACLKLGADVSINYKTQDFVSATRERNGGKGVDVVLDMVAGDYFARNLDLLEPEGRLVEIATQRGEQVTFSLRMLMSKCATVIGSTLRPRSTAQKAAIASELFKNVWPLLAAKKVCPLIDQVFDLASAADAHRRIEGGEHIGKIVLKI